MDQPFPGVGLYLLDTNVFPCAWYFASFGGLDGHHTAILETCTSMPLRVTEAEEQGQCSVLEPGERVETQVPLYAGRFQGGER